MKVRNSSSFAPTYSAVSVTAAWKRRTVSAFSCANCVVVA